ncbi:MAG: ABC transporter permease [Deltaproteobacteria bacterium]|nr:ABC transporter permease [Deltaproteobacteria bacterium]
MHISFRHELGRDPWFITGIGLGLVLLLLAGLGPVFSPYDPHDISFRPLSPPSADHWLGVNDGGMDIFSELLFGMRNTAGFGILAGFTALFLGVAVGLAAAWFGGFTDQIAMRLADVVLAVPSVMILIMAASLFRPSPVMLAVILSIISWPTTAKAIRSQALVVKNRLHIHAARQAGASGIYILARHLLPELFPLYLIGFAAKARMAMFMEASLAFLGLLDPARKSLGIIISFALKYYYMDIWWNWLLPPVILLSLLTMTVTFLVISLEKVFDPRLKEAL